MPPLLVLLLVLVVGPVYVARLCVSCLTCPWPALRRSALQRLNVSAQGTDRLNTSHPEAPSARVQLIVPLADDLQDAGAAHYVLNGFNLSMHCNASCGPCNSNGDWITDFNLTLGPCPRASLQASAAAAPWCAHLAVTRGWTPSHGGGKALNDCMDYRCTVDVLRLPPALIVASVSAQRQRSLFAPINVTTHSVPLVPGLCAPDPCPTAFRSLTWQLTSNQYPNRGRYLERLVFAVAPVEAAPTPNTSLHVLAGLTSPALTTYPSNYTMTYTIDVLQLGAQPVPNSIAPPLAATWVVNGTVCKNDPLSGFECAAHGLSPQLNTMVPLPSSDQHGLFAWAL
ncbi:uncharacterized protein MONBRDRAFT_11097 [Monosiga brevicollis MX1]|uniref:Uncharacterized protein n=1 Tax=Monosiga brevicollis TaxID=81824 RepID=A9V872_MONBE|nr:uncharacterized protein MONBRDRAFT_11097 [Monosiga brevicollis MX1]EDQ86220.1 predicted protein [Monosiga brevicollis MX1]|eukprot:XP_001748890.1 hypothetical protein [Monosiga brevicollis MX1]